MSHHKHLIANEMHRLRITTEIVDSERRYLQSLRFLNTSFAQRLKPPTISQERHASLFSNLIEIINMSDFLQQELGSRLAAFEDRIMNLPDSHPPSLVHKLEEPAVLRQDDSDCIPLLVGDIVCQLAPFFRIYTTYCVNFANALQTVSELMSDNHAWFQKVLRDASASSNGAYQRFDSLLILPIQRIPRLLLLLEVSKASAANDLILPETLRGHADFPSRPLQCDEGKSQNFREYVLLSMNALFVNEILLVASFINVRIRQHEIAQEMLSIQRSLTGFNEVLLVPGRSLEMSAKITKVCRRVDQARQLFLFSDILIYAMPMTKIWSSDTNFVFHRKIDLKNCSVKSIDDGHWHAFQVASPEKSFIAYTESSERTKFIVDKILAAIVKLREARNSLKIDTELVNFEAPVWIPNKFSDVCMICETSFTMLNRKHHCRRCGSIVCHSCSQNTFAIPAMKDRLSSTARECDRCHATHFAEPSSPDNPATSLDTLLSFEMDHLRVRQDSMGSVSTFSSASEYSLSIMRKAYSAGSLVPDQKMTRGIPGSGGSGRSEGSRRDSVTGLSIRAKRSSSFSTALSTCLVGKCALCSEIFGFGNGKKVCNQCGRSVCHFCSKPMDSKDLCDACSKGVPPDSVFIHADGNGWSFVMETDEP